MILISILFVLKINVKKLSMKGVLILFTIGAIILLGYLKMQHIDVYKRQGIVSVIVHHVHYNTNAVLVKCHNKLFELSYPALRVIRVFRI